MRHIRSLIVAIVVAPLAWVLLALGQTRSAGAFSGKQGGALQADDFLWPVVMLAGAGLLLGVLCLLRLSPLGALVVGVGYTLSYTMLLVEPAQVVDVIGRDLSIAGNHIDLAAPIRTGTAMLLGVLLLVGTAGLRRWQRWPVPTGDMDGPMIELGRPLGGAGLDLRSRDRDLEPETTTQRQPAQEQHATVPEPYGAWGEYRRQ